MCGYFCIGFIDFMLAGKKLTDYTNLFSPHDLEKNYSIILSYSKDAWTKLRLYEIKNIENYFINEISETESCRKKLNKYVTIFNYIDKILIVLSATSGGVSVISFSGVIGATARIASASLTLIFPLTTGIVTKLVDITRKKKKKHDKILMLAKSKFNSIDILISQASIDMDISHEEFITILKEKDRYEMMKKSLKNKNGRESYEIIRFDSVKSNT